MNTFSVQKHQMAPRVPPNKHFNRANYKASLKVKPKVANEVFRGIQGDN